MGLGNVESKKRGGGGGGDWQPRENVVIRVTGYEVAEKGKVNVDKDYVVGVLERDALGLEAGTEIRAKLMQKKGDYNRREIAELPRKKGMQKAVKVDGMIELQRAFHDKRSNALVGTWIKPLMHDPSLEEEMVLPSALGVIYNVNQYGGQRGQIILPHNAQEIESYDDMVEKGQAMFEANPPGDPGFILSAYDTNRSPDEGRFAIMVSARTVKEEDGSYRRETFEEAFARAVDPENERTEHARTIVDALKDRGEGEVWEIIPLMTCRIGSSSAEAAAAVKDKDVKERAKADMSFGFELITGRSRNGEDYTRCFMTNANFVLKKIETEDNQEIWSMIYGNPVKPYKSDGSFYSMTSIVTPNTPPAFAEHHEAHAAGLYKFYKDKLGQSNSNSQEQGSGQEMDYDNEGSPAPGQGQ